MMSADNPFGDDTFASTKFEKDRLKDLGKMSECKKEGCSREACLINGDYCSSTCWIVGLEKEKARLRSLVETTEADLFEQKKKRRRLEKENAALVKRWAELKATFQLTIELYEDDEDLDSANVSMSRQALDEMNKLEAGSK